MAGSQLKRLKASLREQGIIGSQQTKKQKRRNAQDPRPRDDKRLPRSEALHSIREQFNPFQFKMSARGPKFHVTTSQPAGDKPRKGIQGRPGASRARGEEKRRQTILAEMNRGSKVGSINDKRFGEANPYMSLEDKMIERFVAEKQRSYKRRSVFNLDGDGLDEPLTHGGRSISFDEDASPPKEDFDERDIPSDDDSDSSRTERKEFLKRLRVEEGKEEDSGEEEGPQRKKTKKEIMTEVIAKSKLYKYERQAVKEEDRDLIAEINQELPDLRNLLFQQRGPKPGALTTEDKPLMDKEYDVRVKQLATDKRAQPAERTKTEEERAEEERDRLKELEEKRLRRMRGQQVGDDEGDDDAEKEEKEKPNIATSSFAIPTAEDEDEFGLGRGVRLRPMATELGLDDEDDFLIDDDLVASGSEVEDDDTEGSEGGDSGRQEESESEDEFVKGLLTEAERPIFESVAQANGDDENGVPYTFPCPQTHDQMLAMCKDIDVTKLPLVVQRIRALYHPKLDQANKERLGKFSQVLVQHVAFLAGNLEPGGIAILEALTRHVHSLAKSFPTEVALAYRLHLEEIKGRRPLALDLGDLISLTGISTVFPTSDHFHQVTTPAMLSIARFLGQKVPKTLVDFAKGTYLAILSLQYQQLAKRYVPELMNFCLNTLQALAPTRPAENLGDFPVHEPGPGIRIRDAKGVRVRKLNFADCRPPASQPSAEASNSLQIAIVSTIAALLKHAAETWHAHAAFYETFQPAGRVLQHLLAPAAQPQRHLPAALLAQLADADASVALLVRLAQVSRRPLELHHHRPLPIRTFVPRFEDEFNPDRHYDPDRARAELARLQAEHRRERRGAMRELRRDAEFVAREALRRRKDRDAAYDKKYKRLVAEIQGDEGHAANEYAREKAARKKRR